MELFLNIYKRQVLTVFALIVTVAVFSILSLAEAAMFILITLGIVLAVYGISRIVLFLATPSIFRSCDTKFFTGLFSILIGGACIFEFIRIICK